MRTLSALSAFENPGALSPQAITDLINHETGGSLIDFSFRLLDRDLNPISVPGAPASDPAEMPPKYVWNTKLDVNGQRDNPRQLSLDLVELPGISYSPLQHRVQPFVDYYAGGTYEDVGGGRKIVKGGERILHLPQGIFMGVLPEREHTGQVPVWKGLNLYDETYRLSRLKFRTHYVAKAGQGWVSTAKTLLTLPLDATAPSGCAISGPGFPSSRVVIPDAGSVIPVDQTWTDSDTFVGAVNTALKGSDVPYWPILPDEWGVLGSIRQPYYSATTPPPGWIFDTTPGKLPGEPGVLIVQSPVKQTFGDFSTLFNEVTVIGENPNADAVSATAQNNNLNSAISRPNLGFTMNAIIHNSNVVTIEQATLAAQLALQTGAVLNETISFGCMPVPVMQLHDGIGFTLRALGISSYIGTGADIDVAYAAGPVIIDGSSTPFEVLSYSLDFNTRIQSVVAGRTIGV